MSERKYILNDLFINEDSLTIPIDLYDFFPKKEVNAIFHNNWRILEDIQVWVLPKIDLSINKKIKIDYLRNFWFVEIIWNKKKKSPTIILKKFKKIFLSIDLSSKLPKLQKNTLDIREMKECVFFKEYPDIYKLPSSISKKWYSFFRKHKKLIIRSFTKWFQFSFLIFLILWTFVLFWIWLKNYIQAEVIDSYQKIYNFKNIKNWSQLKSEALKVKNKLNLLSLIFTPANLLWNNFIYKNDNIVLADNVIKWWSQISEIMANFWQIYLDFESLPEINKNEIWLKKIENIKITDFLKNEDDNILKIKNSLDKAIWYYSKIGKLPDPSLNSKFSKVMADLLKSSLLLDFYIKNRNEIFDMLWDTKPQRYLILNQNNDEIRANWWFPGSVITLELYKWNIRNYDKKDVYYYDWHITPYLETPPEWLNIISPNHWLRDANYFPIFRESVEKINFFYEKWGWASIDSVIAINQNLITDFLMKYWKVNLPEVNIDITNKNFSLIMSTLVENKFGKVDSPKDILFKFTEKLEQKLLDRKDFFWYFDIISDNFKKWEILISSRNEEIQNFLEQYNYSEKWKYDESNWFYPVFTSISWNKSDRYMQRTFNIETKANSDCSISNKFSFISTNTFWENEKNEIEKLFNDLKITDIWERERLTIIEWAWENRQFVRILVPKWTKLNSKAENINIDTSNSNYDFIKFYTITPKSKISTQNFEYITYPKSCSNQTNFYRQPWLNNYKVNINNVQL
ncbi:MAG: hypothetical protein ACD_4C00238G0012 [uncultured bacterium (gcode 4)]|uniref:Uncharacterized protein n=1 Tax=uncultured bacterium (gcode 4) TaxID=1234023 RepID=K2FUI6_9BACT|nr:MAG: hypothetical protein ACD_4C00238G0012 [uncultured bacterium (gcode 4)]